MPPWWICSAKGRPWSRQTGAVGMEEHLDTG